MDLLVRWAVRRPHVLAVEVPGQWHLRARLDHELVCRGWPAASSPADADVLAVCGQPGPELCSAVDLVWDQMPGPRVRAPLTERDEVGAVLDGAVAALHDTHRQRHRESTPPPEHPNGEADDADSAMAPGGIPLAEGAQDRDGLEMDVLHVRLGPILPHWPGGLVLCCDLHGDVIADADAVGLDVEQHRVKQAGRRMPAARQCDHIVDVLDLAGWPGAAQRARRARDALLDDSDPVEVAALLDDLELAVRRSRVLRWSLRELGVLSSDELRRRGLPASWCGDAYDRVLTRIELARNNIAPEVVDADLVGSLSAVVSGLDVATARLVIASLGLDIASAAADGRDD